MGTVAPTSGTRYPGSFNNNVTAAASAETLPAIAEIAAAFPLTRLKMPPAKRAQYCLLTNILAFCHRCASR